MDAFLIVWDGQDVQGATQLVEAMDTRVCGAATGTVDEAVDAICRTDPDLVIAWANQRPERTQEVLARVIQEDGRVAPLPTVFVDAAGHDKGLLSRYAAPAVFTDVYDLEAAIQACRMAVKKAHKALEHARAD